jgi:hypothetical protein
MSIPLRAFATRKPTGIDPSRYAAMARAANATGLAISRVGAIPQRDEERVRDDHVRVLDLLHVVAVRDDRVPD